MSTKLKQRLIQLETINYDYHRHISELLVVRNDSYEKEAAPEGMKKGFSLNNNLEGDRKKIFDAKNEPSQSNSSYESNNELLDRSKLLEHKKQVLNKTLNLHSNKTEIDWDNEISSCDSECDTDKGCEMRWINRIAHREKLDRLNE